MCAESEACADCYSEAQGRLAFVRAQYERGIEALQETLRKLGRCEAEFGGEEDWYDRYGFIYFTFMKDRYRRSPSARSPRPRQG